jgi:hypothetical protein
MADPIPGLPMADPIPGLPGQAASKANATIHSPNAAMPGGFTPSGVGATDAQPGWSTVPGPIPADDAAAAGLQRRADAAAARVRPPDWSGSGPVNG